MRAVYLAAVIASDTLTPPPDGGGLSNFSLIVSTPEAVKGSIFHADGSDPKSRNCPAKTDTFVPGWMPPSAQETPRASERERNEK